MRSLRLILLGLALLGAQLALAAHGIEHPFHEHDEACVECLVLPGFAAMPAPVLAAPAPVTAPMHAGLAVSPASTFPSPQPYRSRAPPVFQNC